MKSKEEMIEEILEDVNNWDLDSLLDFATTTINEKLLTMSDEELMEEWKLVTQDEEVKYLNAPCPKCGEHKLRACNVGDPDNHCDACGSVFPVKE